MSKKKTEPKNPAGDFMELLGEDPMKAGLMMGFELGKQLRKNMELITKTLLGIEAHLFAIRDFHEQKEAEKQASQIISSAIETLNGPGPASNAVPDCR